MGESSHCWRLGRPLCPDSPGQMADLSDNSTMADPRQGYGDLGPESVTVRCSVAGSVEPARVVPARVMRRTLAPGASRGARRARDQRGLESCERYALEPPSQPRLRWRLRPGRLLRLPGRRSAGPRGPVCGRRDVRSRRVLLRGPVRPAEPAVPVRRIRAVRPVRRVLGGIRPTAGLRARLRRAGLSGRRTRPGLRVQARRRAARGVPGVRRVRGRRIRLRRIRAGIRSGLSVLRRRGLRRRRRRRVRLPGPGRGALRRPRRLRRPAVRCRVLLRHTGPTATATDRRTAAMGTDTLVEPEAPPAPPEPAAVPGPRRARPAAPARPETAPESAGPGSDSRCAPVPAPARSAASCRVWCSRR